MPHDDHLGTRGRRRNSLDLSDDIATRVISVVNERQVLGHDGARQFVLDLLSREVLSPGDFNAEHVFEELRGHRLSADAIIDLYIPSTARGLGQSWVENGIGFAQVTIGTLRLQALLDHVAARSLQGCFARGLRKRVLLVLPQSEQHFLGVSVVAAQLRRLGCTVSVSFDESLAALQRRVSEDRPSVVMISSSRKEAVKIIRKTVQTIRNVAEHDLEIVLGGAIMLDGASNLEAKELMDKTGVDMVTADAIGALRACAGRATVSVRS